MSEVAPTEVLLDARVIARGHTGITRYVQQLASRIPSSAPIRLTGLVNQNQAPLAGSVGTVEARSLFLNPAEQLELPPRVASWRASHGRHGVFWVPAYNAACVAPGPLVMTIHDANHLALAENYGPAHAVYYRTVVRLAALRSRAVITVSEFAKREIVERIGIPEHHIQVIPNGVDGPAPPTEEAIERVRRFHFLTRPYVVYLGNFKPHKNLEMLLRSAMLFGRDVMLVLVGGTEAELGNALPAARSWGVRVTVLRNLPDHELWPVLAGAAAFAFPSRYEGFGLPPLEAMSLGVPVVTTTAGSLPEVVGDAALTVDPDDAEGFGKAIDRILGDRVLSAELRRRGRERAALYSWDQTARRTARVLIDAAQG
jgi:glycosyltransferase involved in cell wall biosynthesis